jgi:hypothetical protein
MTELQSRILHPMQVQPGSSRTMQAALGDIRDTISMAEHSKTPVCVAALDISGAFNNLRHSFLWESLRRHGVGDGVLRLLQSMYDGASTRVRVNGVLTEPVPLQRGIRQGCPASMMLYNMASAALIKALDGRLQGIELDGGRMAASSYVDDTVAVLTGAVG